MVNKDVLFLAWATAPDLHFTIVLYRGKSAENCNYIIIEKVYIR